MLLVEKVLILLEPNGTPQAHLISVNLNRSTRASVSERLQLRQQRPLTYVDMFTKQLYRKRALLPR